MKQIIGALIVIASLTVSATLTLIGRVDTVTGASFFYTNSSRTGFFYPSDASYTNTAILGITNVYPIVYAGENQNDSCQWLTMTPALGNSFFLPPNVSISSFRWRPTAIGPTSAIVRIQAPGEPANGFQQRLYFNVIPEPAAVLFTAMASAAVVRRRFHS
ncbi:hypothetical protein GX586_14665 [bacterium]|nr:hypothetical protein [bacterium]